MRKARSFGLLAPLVAGVLVSAALTRQALPQAPPASTAAPVSVSAPAAAPAGAPSRPSMPVEEYSLSNGLRVILAPDATLPNVAVHVRYDAGSADEPEGLAGIAHLVEHLMFERSKHVPRGAYLRMLANAGASDLNGMTAFDGTYYYETVPPERLELALWLESDRMGYFLPAIDERAVEQEKTVVWNELRTRYLDEPGGIGDIVVFGATFPSWHPYHATPAGTEQDIRRITLADVKAFAATWCSPANATLVVAGRFDRDQGKALIAKYFATLQGRPPPRRPDLPSLARAGQTRVEIEADVNVEEVRLTWVTPPLGAPGDAALDRVAVLLTNGEASRLQQRLVAGGLASWVQASQSSRRLASVFLIDAVAARGVRAEQIIAAIDEELSNLFESGPTQKEMMRVQSRWATRDMFTLETAMGRASRLSEAAELGPIREPFDWAKQASSTFTAADVHAAVQRHLSPAARAAVVITRYAKGAPLAGAVVRTEEP